MTAHAARDERVAILKLMLRGAGEARSLSTVAAVSIFTGEALRRHTGARIASLDVLTVCVSPANTQHYRTLPDRESPSHGGNPGSNPGSGTCESPANRGFFSLGAYQGAHMSLQP